MAKLLELSSIEIPTDSKKFDRFIDDAVAAYGNGKVRIHAAACFAILWARDHGDASKLNRLHKALETMDGMTGKEAGKLKRWAGKVVTYTHQPAEGGPVERKWMDWSNDKKTNGEVKGFFVIAGREDGRETVFAPELLDGTRFYNTDKSAPIDPTLELLLKYLASVEKTVDKKASDKVSLPAAIKEALANLTAIAKATPATAH